MVDSLCGGFWRLRQIDTKKEEGIVSKSEDDEIKKEIWTTEEFERERKKEQEKHKNGKN